MKINYSDLSSPAGSVRHSLSNYSNAKNVQGIYFIVDSNDHVIYVGESIHVRTRLKEHYDGDGNKCVYSNRNVSYFYANYEEKYANETSRKNREQVLIKKYDPKCND